MSKLSLFVASLRKKLFGREQRQTDYEPILSPQEAKAPSHEISDSTPVIATDRPPHFIQIGFDFGTSYCKCICRDVMINRAWVCLLPEARENELPFLIPSALVLKDGVIGHVGDCRFQYPKNGLYNLKNALVKTALGELDDPVLAPYRGGDDAIDGCSLSELVETCAVYFLAGAFGLVRKDIRRRLTDFGNVQDDYMAVNLAVPVADAERPTVNALFQKILCEAWSLADQLVEHPSIALSELTLLREDYRRSMNPFSDDSCFIYPEVSANVQGFVRSRVSRPGIYLFSDTGAGTVDQSAFIFMRREKDQSEHLTYLHGNVLPLGSGQIELRAASISGSTDPESLEMWRVKKERRDNDRELILAFEWIAQRLFAGTQASLAFTKKKLYVPDQLNEMKVIFGGGGHCEYPYKAAVMYPFTQEISGSLFRQSFVPDVVGLPVPSDLEIDGPEALWMRRLTVAYGLSFVKSDLASFTYPKDVVTPKPDQIWPRRKELPDAPSQDVC